MNGVVITGISDFSGAWCRDLAAQADNTVKQNYRAEIAAIAQVFDYSPTPLKTAPYNRYSGPLLHVDAKSPPAVDRDSVANRWHNDCIAAG